MRAFGHTTKYRHAEKPPLRVAPFLQRTKGKHVNANLKLACAMLAGVVICAVGIESSQAQSKPPGYLVIEFQVTDPAGWKAYADAARALPTSGTFLVRATKGISLAGDSPKTITLIKFPSVDDALAFDASAAYVALKAGRDSSSNWRSYVVEGLPN
jgi:uncharacterized protein (DUF1330 family)